MSPVVPDSAFEQHVFPQGQEAYNTINRTTPENFGGQVGATLGQAGNMLAEHAVQRQQLINETAVQDIYANQFSPQMNTIYQNYMKLEGKDAEAQFGAFQQQMNDLRSQIRASFPNMMQQKLFDERSNSRVESDLTGMSRYGASQTKTWEWNTHNAVMGDLVAEGAANYNNPQRLADIQGRIDRTNIDYGATHGWSDEVTKHQMNENQGKFWTAVIERTALDNIYQAQQILDQKTKDGILSGAAQLQLQEKLRPQFQQVQAIGNVANATGSATAQQLGQIAQQRGVDPSDIVTAWSCEGSVSNPTTKNPKSNAVGIGQFIPSTWAQMGHSDQDRYDKQTQMEVLVDHWKQNSTALARDLGQQPQSWQVYLAHQQGLDGAKSLLHADPNANAGATVGNLDAITNNMPGSNANTTVGQFNDWIKNFWAAHARQWTPDGNPTAQNLSDNFGDNLAKLNQIQDPGERERAINELHRTTSMASQAQAQDYRNQSRTVWNAITGDKPALSWDDITGNPQTKAAYDYLYATDHSIHEQIDHQLILNVARAYDPPATPETDKINSQLVGLARTEPQKFAGTDLNPYRGAMPDYQWQALKSEQAKIQDKDAATMLKGARLTTALSDPIGARTIAIAAATKGTPFYGMNKDGGVQDQLKYYQFLGKLDAQLDAVLQANKGQPITPEQMRQTVQDIAMPEGMPAPKPPKPPEPKQPGLWERMWGGGTEAVAPGQTGAQQAQTEQQPIDFSKFKPENQDATSQAIAKELQAQGKIVSDETITATKALLEAHRTAQDATSLPPGALRRYVGGKPNGYIDKNGIEHEESELTKKGDE